MKFAEKDQNSTETCEGFRKLGETFEKSHLKNTRPNTFPGKS